MELLAEIGVGVSMWRAVHSTMSVHICV